MSHKTGERVELTFHMKEGDKNSYVEGTGYDANGQPVLKISGSWLFKLVFTDLRTGQSETVWEQPALIPDAHLQYFMNRLAVKLNERVDGMEGVVAPTDTRWRDDVRLLEEGDDDGSEQAKVKIEEEQRRTRREMEKNKQVHVPRFFEQINHPHIRADTKVNHLEKQPCMWIVKEGELGYWERRKNGNWADMPRLYGPFN